MELNITNTKLCLEPQKKNIYFLEQVQKRVTKIRHETKNHQYESRMVMFEITILIDHRKKKRFQHNLDEINWDKSPVQRPDRHKN